MTMLEKYAHLPRLTEEEIKENQNRPRTGFSREGCEEGYFKLIHKDHTGIIKIEILADKDFLPKM